jgi:hypothetical protein
MNIFVLDTDPLIAAQYHCDKHISKMILESAQMLSTVLKGPYRSTHVHHPCTKWVAQSQANALWLWHLMVHLNGEYITRWNKDDNHLAYSKCAHLISSLHVLPNTELTPFALAMPEQYKNDDPVLAYRAYYRSKSFAVWRNGAPSWWQDHKLRQNPSTL